jgi:hypothetical protein
VPAGAAVPNGYGVCIDELVSGGPCDYAVRLPRAAADVTGGKFLGVVVEQFSVEQLPVTVGAAYALAVSPLIPGVLNVLHEGRCYVKVEEAVLAGDAAFCRYAAGGLGLGAWRKSTGTSEAAAVPRAKFLTAAAANGIAILEMVR